MDGKEQHHLREVPPNATSRHRIRDPHRVAGQIHRGVFPCHVGALESSAIRDRSTTPDHPSEESSAIPSGALVFVVVGDWRRELFVGCNRLLAAVLKLNYLSLQRNSIHSTVPSPAYWFSPAVNQLKCNVDVAIYENGASYGVVVRDHNGRFVDACGVSGMSPLPSLENGLNERSNDSVSGSGLLYDCFPDAVVSSDEAVSSAQQMTSRSERFFAGCPKLQVV
nr:uncharacterized protein LOC109177579 [Ipomoea batatas]